MEACWLLSCIWLMATVCYAGYNEEKRECRIVHIPHVICGSNVDDVCLTPLYELISNPYYSSDLINKGSTASQNDDYRSSSSYLDKTSYDSTVGPTKDRISGANSNSFSFDGQSSGGTGNGNNQKSQPNYYSSGHTTNDYFCPETNFGVSQYSKDDRNFGKNQDLHKGSENSDSSTQFIFGSNSNGRQPYPSSNDALDNKNTYGFSGGNSYGGPNSQTGSHSTSHYQSPGYGSHPGSSTQRSYEYPTINQGASNSDNGLYDYDYKTSGRQFYDDQGIGTSSPYNNYGDSNYGTSANTNSQPNPKFDMNRNSNFHYNSIGNDGKFSTNNYNLEPHQHPRLSSVNSNDKSQISHSNQGPEQYHSTQNNYGSPTTYTQNDDYRSTSSYSADTSYESPAVGASGNRISGENSNSFSFDGQSSGGTGNGNNQKSQPNYYLSDYTTNDKFPTETNFGVSQYSKDDRNQDLHKGSANFDSSKQFNVGSNSNGRQPHPSSNGDALYTPYNQNGAGFSGGNSFGSQNSQTGSHSTSHYQSSGYGSHAGPRDHTTNDDISRERNFGGSQYSTDDRNQDLHKGSANFDSSKQFNVGSNSNGRQPHPSSNGDALYTPYNQNGAGFSSGNSFGSQNSQTGSHSTSHYQSYGYGGHSGSSTQSLSEHNSDYYDHKTSGRQSNDDQGIRTSYNYDNNNYGPSATNSKSNPKLDMESNLNVGGSIGNDGQFSSNNYNLPSHHRSSPSNYNSSDKSQISDSVQGPEQYHSTPNSYGSTTTTQSNSGGHQNLQSTHPSQSAHQQVNPSDRNSHPSNQGFGGTQHSFSSETAYPMDGRQHDGHNYQSTSNTQHRQNYAPSNPYIKNENNFEQSSSNSKIQNHPSSLRSEDGPNTGATGYSSSAHGHNVEGPYSTIQSYSNGNQIVPSAESKTEDTLNNNDSTLSTNHKNSNHVDVNTNSPSAAGYGSHPEPLKSSGSSSTQKSVHPESGKGDSTPSLKEGKTSSTSSPIIAGESHKGLGAESSLDSHGPVTQSGQTGSNERDGNSYINAQKNSDYPQAHGGSATHNTKHKMGNDEKEVVVMPISSPSGQPMLYLNPEYLHDFCQKSSEPAEEDAQKYDLDLRESKDTEEP